jgi:hypothetical protein
MVVVAAGLAAAGALVVVGGGAAPAQQDPPLAVGFTSYADQPLVYQDLWLGTVSCSAAATVEVSLQVTQGTAVRSNTSTVVCAAPASNVELAISGTGLVAGAATAVTSVRVVDPADPPVSTDPRTETVTLLAPVGISFGNAPQYPFFSNSALLVTVSCGFPATLEVKYVVENGSLVQSSKHFVTCTGVDFANLPLNEPFVTQSLPGTRVSGQVRAVGSFGIPVEYDTTIDLVAPGYIGVIGVQLDETGYRGPGTYYLGGTVTCSRPVELTATVTLDGSLTGSVPVSCGSSGIVGFLAVIEGPGTNLVGPVPAAVTVAGPDVGTSATRTVDIL